MFLRHWAGVEVDLGGEPTEWNFLRGGSSLRRCQNITSSPRRCSNDPPLWQGGEVLAPSKIRGQVAAEDTILRGRKLVPVACEYQVVDE